MLLYARENQKGEGDDESEKNRRDPKAYTLIPPAASSPDTPRKLSMPPRPPLAPLRLDEPEEVRRLQEANSLNESGQCIW